HAKVFRFMSDRPLAAQDVVRFGPDLAVESPGSDDRDREHPLRRIASTWIHDVTIKLTLCKEKFLVISRCGDGSVFQINFGGCLLFIFRIADADIPAARVVGRGSNAVNTGPAAGDEAGGDAITFEDGGHFIDGISFSHAARIEAHTGSLKPYSAMGRVELNILIADLSEGGTDFSTMRQAACSLIEAPNLHQRSHSHIEGAFTLAAVCLAFFEEREQFRRDGDG